MTSSDNMSDGTCGGVSDRQSAWLHRFALLVMVATFLLIIAGGNVTSKGAGMSVPDWPRSFGSFSPDGWTTDMNGTKPGVRAEHGHRLLGATVGLLVIGLVVLAHRTKSRLWVRALAYAALAGVVTQGVMGGLRVREMSLTLALVHGCFAQAFFCLTVILASVTSRRWVEGMRRSGGEPERMLRFWCGLLVVAVYLQLVLGAVYRHTGSGLVAHIGGALVTGMVLMQLSQQAFRRPIGQDEGLSKLTLVLFGLVGLQVVLGVMTFVVVAPIHGEGGLRMYASSVATYLPTAHLVMGSLIMGWSVHLAMRALSARAAGQASGSEQGDLRGAMA